MILRLLRRCSIIVIIAGGCLALTSATAALALHRPSIDRLQTATLSRLRADYSADPHGMSMAPMKAGVVQAAATDTQPLSTATRRAAPSRTTIQQAVPATPTPTAVQIIEPRSPTPRPRPSPQPTEEPEPTEAHEPEPTKTAEPAPTKTEDDERRTATPEPTQSPEEKPTATAVKTAPGNIATPTAGQDSIDRSGSDSGSG